MPYITLLCNGLEKTLGEWGIKSCQRECENTAQDNLGFDMSTAATGADPFPYGTQITIYLGRTGSAFNALGIPTAFSGGAPWFQGYRKRHVRAASGRLQAFKYKFTGPWGYFMEQHVFQKFALAWNGLQGSAAGLVMQPRSQITLGQSLTTLTEPNGDQTTNMTIAQQVVEIVNFTIAQTVAQTFPNSPQIGGVGPMPIVLPLNQGTNCNAVISAFIASHAARAAFAIDTTFATDANFNITGTNPLNGSGAAGGWLGMCPMDAANDLTCAEALKKTVKIMPGVSMWFDFYTTANRATRVASPIPVLHVATRDTLDAVTLPFGNSSAASPYGHITSSIDRRDDMVPTCVDYKYRITTTANGQSFIAIYDDVACEAGQTGSTGTLNNPGSPTIQLTGHGAITPSDPTYGTDYNNALATLLPFTEYFGAEVATFDFSGGSSTQTTLITNPIPFSPSGSTDPASPSTPNSDFLAWFHAIVPSLSNKTVSAVSIPAGTVVTLVDSSGNAANSAYKYYMIGGPVPSGLSDSSGNVQGVQMTLSCTFKYTENTPLSDGTLSPCNTKTETKTVNIAAFTTASATYGSITSEAEPVPFGLAAFVYNIEKIPQFDGTHSIVEADAQTKYPTITDACPIGTNINVAIPATDPNYAAALAAGTVAEYAGMNAQTQSVSYDLTTGHTDITFGVASHLGGSEMIERLRINRGPRWFREINPTLINSGGSSGNISGPTQLKDTQSSASAHNFSWMPAGETANGSANPPTSTPGGPPGIYFDTRTTSQPSYGSVSTTHSPVIYVSAAAGAVAGQSFNWVKIDAGNPSIQIQAGNPVGSDSPVLNLTALGSGAPQIVMVGGLSTSQPGDGGGPVISMQENGLGTTATITIYNTKTQVRMQLQDCLGYAGSIFFQEYQCCYDFGDGNGPVPAFVILLGSKPYKTTLVV